jgi:deoxyribose-phosphate aldolase
MPPHSAASEPVKQTIERLLPMARLAVEQAGGPFPQRIPPAIALGDRSLRGADLAPTIDHTLVKPGTTPQQVDRMCAEAVEHGFAAVCVNASLLTRAVSALRGTRVRVSCVVGCPQGATTPEVKAVETDQAVLAGAQEVDMIIDLGHLRAGDYRRVAEDLAAVVRPAHAGGVWVKAILETAMLTHEEKVMASLLAVQAGIDFVKTSTGINAGGATQEDVRLLRDIVGPTLGVKAAGGIRTLADAEAMIAAGASRLGTSAGVQIMQQAQDQATGIPRDQEAN